MLSDTVTTSIAISPCVARRRRFGPSQAGYLGRRQHANQRQVEPFEKRVLLDVSGAPLRAEPLSWVLVQQAGYEVPSVQLKRARARGGGERQRLLYDVPQRSLVRWGRIRRTTVYELVDEYPE